MTERTLACPELVMLTVEALVDCRRDAAETMQVLVSKWRPPDRFDRFAAHDAGRTDSLDSTGYFGDALSVRRYCGEFRESHERCRVREEGLATTESGLSRVTGGRRCRCEADSGG